MPILGNIRHYVQAVIWGVRNGTLLRTTNRFMRYRHIERTVARHYGLTVQEGPFAGMKYITIPPNHAFIPKLLGFYEQELQPSIGEILNRNYDTIINIGSAEGYYAVGFALRFPQAKVYAYDIAEREQAMCHELTARNRVTDRVYVRGRCDAEALQSLIEGRTLIIADCEGCEYDVLDPTIAQRLADADMLIEVHDFGGSTRIGSALQARFTDTHNLKVISSQPRRPEDHPLVSFLKASETRRLAVKERDVPQRWYYLRSRMRSQTKLKRSTSACSLN